MTALGIRYDDEASPGTESDPLVIDNNFRILDEVPVYPLVLAVREDIICSIDTTCTYDQLKSPQTHQFLVRPALDRMKARKSYAIVYALLANSGQFQREAGQKAALSGVSATRASLCELLATKMLKEFNPRELIDVLTFGFWPLRGQSNGSVATYSGSRTERMSAIEIAIHAESKKFLSSPLVVQALENIWSGKIVFYSSTDKGYDAISFHHTRKTASFYNVKEASLFKLSRLRVPRYRHFMQTVCFAILLGLYMAVLIQRTQLLTSLEIFMSIWALGYMLDEVVGFFNAGSTLFLLNLWNLFDMGILTLFVAFLGIRLYGFLIGDPSQAIADTAYDLLAANAVFLFPRLFAALDHTRYFSQMIISFRRMAFDLLASLLFIVVFFTGFFVAFSVTFARGIYSTRTVAFNFLQIFFGFQLPAWQTIHSYNTTGKILLVLFVGMAHFLVVTILVSVLSNTFSAVSKNAREEHQYLFALNTISCVKSDAFFFYQPPFNLIEWTLQPLCYVLPHRKFIKLNRYVIKATHLPFLATIYCFERFYLGSKSVSGYVPLHRLSSFETLANGFSGNQKPDHVYATIKRRGYRRESIATQAAQNVLDEVFRSSIRGHRGPAVYNYGTGISGTIKPSTAQWIQEIPTPMLRPVNKMESTRTFPPLVTISAALDAATPKSTNTKEFKHPTRRRKISLASTVIESDEETSDNDVLGARNRLVSMPGGEGHEGDDEYDEANSILDEHDASDMDTKPNSFPIFSIPDPPLRRPMSAHSPRKSLKPSQRRSRKVTTRSQVQERDNRLSSSSSRESRRTDETLTKSEASDPVINRQWLEEKLVSLERLVEEIRKELGGNKD